jgi:hypothetical protein
METIIFLLNIIAVFITIILTIMMLWTFRRERPINHLAPLLSILISLELLVFYLLISGSRLNLWLSGFLILSGFMIGFIRGLIVTLKYEYGQVVGKMPLFFLFCWGFSLVFAQILNIFGSVLLSSLGLIPLIFTTGIQAGISSGIFLRRLMMRRSKPTYPIS